jgi:protein involved in polysaccharide export with SLBB domain
MILRLLILSLTAIVLSGCFAGRGSPPNRSALAPNRNIGDSDSAVMAASTTTPAPTRRPMLESPADYRLAPRDQIIFEMFNEPDVKTTQRLSSSGEMTLPLIGAVNLTGMTLRQAEQEVRQRYVKGGYYVDPHVILSVAEYGAHYVTVLGQVNRPDRVELPIEASSLGLVEAITQAGGFTRVARTDAVEITRQTASGAERHFTIDVRKFLGRRGDGATDEFQLQPGDVVFVPERLF